MIKEAEIHKSIESNDDGINDKNESSANNTAKELYKCRKKIYQREKKKIAEQLLTTLNDPTTLVLADWLKVRATIKTWYKVWVELRPGLLVLYKSQKTNKYGQWIGTILLSMCQVIERPSRKDGFCFKLFNPLDQNIWASRGPKGESFGAITMPLPLNSLMLRANSQESGSQWIQAMQLSLRCSKRIIKYDLQSDSCANHHRREARGKGKDTEQLSASENNHETDRNETSCASEDEEDELNVLAHVDHSDDALSSVDQESHSSDYESESMLTFPEDFGLSMLDERPEVHQFVCDDKGQVDSIGEENKSLLWALLKQVRPGKDLSKVVLPTFVLEPRSFLQKLSDYYFHCDILTEACATDCPFERIKLVVKWYVSGFYKKPVGIKKPYNPILGEFFRCAFQNPNGSRTYFLAEQISHHPPKSAFYLCNPTDGYEASGVICVQSKYWINSVSAILEGQVHLRLLNRKELYIITLPYAHCKGVVTGSLTFELGGKVEISCPQSGYSCDLDFKLKPLYGGEINGLYGKIQEHGNTVATIQGRWDKLLFIFDSKSGERKTLWKVDQETIGKRLKLYQIPIKQQNAMESERLWTDVTKAIEQANQHAATAAKTKLEEAQREQARLLVERNQQHITQFFEYCEKSNTWLYKRCKQVRNLARRSVKVRVKTRTQLINNNNNSAAKIHPLNLIKSGGPMNGTCHSKYAKTDVHNEHISNQMQVLIERQEQVRYQLVGFEHKVNQLISNQSRITIKDLLVLFMFVVLHFLKMI